MTTDSCSSVTLDEINPAVVALQALLDSEKPETLDVILAAAYWIFTATPTPTHLKFTVNKLDFDRIANGFVELDVLCALLGPLSFVSLSSSLARRPGFNYSLMTSNNSSRHSTKILDN